MPDAHAEQYDARNASGNFDAQSRLTALGAKLTDPVTLPAALREKADAFSARGTAELDFQDFLRQLEENKLLTTGSEAQTQHVFIEKMFSVYKSAIGLLNYEQDLHVRELVQQATLEGNYVEVPHGAPHTQEGLSLQAEEGVLFTANTQGAYHLYRFPYADYPELSTYDTLRQNVLDHLILSLARSLKPEDVPVEAAK